MGTNYYLKSEKCPKCSHADENLHIGKSSCGWKFLLRAHEDPKISSWQDWIEFLAYTDKKIIDEYGNEIVSLEFLAMVHEKQKFKSQSTMYSEDDHYFYCDDSGFEMCKNYFS